MLWWSSFGPTFFEQWSRRKGGRVGEGRVHKSPILGELLGVCKNFGNFFSNGPIKVAHCK